MLGKECLGEWMCVHVLGCGHARFSLYIWLGELQVLIFFFFKGFYVHDQ